MPNFLCPDCHLPLIGDPLRCENGHSFPVEDGVLRLISAEFKPQLTAFLSQFEQHRAKIGRRITDPAIYEQLPHALAHDPEWRHRVYDLRVIDEVLGRHRKPYHRVAKSDNTVNRTEGSSKATIPNTVLEIGAFNGWLTNHLAQQGHTVTAVDEFADRYDGLGAHNFYRATWYPVQADTRALTTFADQYEVVILNRCTQFFLTPTAYVRQAMEKVADGGQLILLGLTFFRDSRAKKAMVKANYDNLTVQGMHLFKPNKGYLDWDDKTEMEQLGIKLKPYPQMRMRLVNWRARFQPHRAAHFWGVYTKSSLT